MHLGAVQAHRAEPRELIFAGHLQHLHEDRSKVFAKTAAEMGQRVVVGVLIAGDEPKRQRSVAGSLDLAAGVGASGLAVDQQREQQRRVIGRAATTRIRALQLR